MSIEKRERVRRWGMLIPLLVVCFVGSTTAVASAAPCHRDTDCEGERFCVDQKCEPLLSPEFCVDDDDCHNTAEVCDDGVCKQRWVVCRNDRGYCAAEWTAETQHVACACWDQSTVVINTPANDELSDDELLDHCVDFRELHCKAPVPDGLPADCVGAELELCKRYVGPKIDLELACGGKQDDAATFLRSCCAQVGDAEEEVRIRCTADAEFRRNDCSAMLTEVKDCIDDHADSSEAETSGDSGEGDTSDAGGTGDAGSSDAGDTSGTGGTGDGGVDSGSADASSSSESGGDTGTEGASESGGGASAGGADTAATSASVETEGGASMAEPGSGGCGTAEGGRLFWPALARLLLR